MSGTMTPGVKVVVKPGQIAEPFFKSTFKIEGMDLQSGIFIVDEVVHDGRGVKLKYFTPTYRLDDFEPVEPEHT